MKKLAWLIPLLLSATLLLGCADGFVAMRNGYYTAEAKAFDDHGWQEYVTIYVANNRIVTVEYNARNASGFIKSWDQDYMRVMNAVDGTYPNEYTRYYASQLLDTQDPEAVDAISGATNSYQSFKALAAAAIEHARVGDTEISLVDLESAHAAEPAAEDAATSEASEAPAQSAESAAPEQSQSAAAPAVKLNVWGSKS
jgi:major membrane immunogen (membrane-anchored lipoprotein)